MTLSSIGFCFVYFLCFCLIFFRGLAHAAVEPQQGPGQVEMRFGFSTSQEGLAFVPLCDRIRVEASRSLDFSPMEIRLLCGDTSGDQIGVPWANMTPRQVANFMRGFLQSRGYHFPLFIQDGELLFVRLGPVSRLTQFHILGAPSEWTPPRIRFVSGEALTPRLLDNLEEWVQNQMRQEGYVCSSVKSVADPQTGEARMFLQPGLPMMIKGIETVGDAGLRESSLNRYNAFSIGSLYRERLIRLTRERTQNEGFLQTLVLTERCEPDGVIIVRDVVLGPPRAVRVGVGASTDEGARFRVLLKQSRVGGSASAAQIKANISYLNTLVNRQSAESSFRWFLANLNERSFVEPSIVFERDAETAFETQSIEGRVIFGRTHEMATGQVEFGVGPSLLQSYQIRGVGPDSLSTVYIELSVRWLNHDFESFATSPRSGDFLNATAQLMTEGWGSTFTAQRLELRGQKLWNAFRYDPPLLIFGLRAAATTLLSPDSDIAQRIPSRFRFFMGGNSDLRGFSLNSLPRSGVGTLSGATLGAEARLHKVILRKADLFLFVDAGVLGSEELRLEFPVLMSPGFGVRWESPLGSLRGFFAQRFALNEKAGEEPFGKEWRFGFTFGEEF